jgi:DNA primase
LPRLSDEFRRSLEATAARYQMALTEAARAYLLGRGLGPAEVARYRIGLVDGGVPEHEDYAGMLSIPYLTRAGVVSLKFRRAHDCSPNCQHAKYISPYETRLYNTLAMDEADRTGLLGIAEGEVDAMTLDALCGIPSVGIPGVETYSKHPEWKELFRGYKQVLIFPDLDEINPKTGKRPGDELAKALSRDIDTARVVRLPGKDVNETYRAAGADGIRKAAAL